MVAGSGAQGPEGSSVSGRRGLLGLGAVLFTFALAAAAFVALFVIPRL